MMVMKSSTRGESGKGAEREGRGKGYDCGLGGL